MRPTCRFTAVLLPFLLATAAVASDPDTVSALSNQLLSASNPIVRSDAAQALGGKESEAAEAVPALLEALARDSAAAVRHNAAWALGKIGKPVASIVPVLTAALGDPEWSVRHNAGLSLTWIGEPAVASLKSALAAESPMLRVHALATLAIISPANAAEETARLDAMLRDASPGVRSVAAQTAGNLGFRAQPLVPGLIALLGDPEASLRTQALDALRKVGKAAEAAMPQVIEILKRDKERSNRVEAALCLSEISSASPLATEALLAALQDKDARVRSYSAESLARIGAPAVPRLTDALRSEDSRVRLNAAMALGGMEAAARPALGALIAGLEDPEVGVRTYSAAALGAIGDATPEAILALSQAMDRERADSVAKAYFEKAISMLRNE